MLLSGLALAASCGPPSRPPTGHDERFGVARVVPLATPSPDPLRTARGLLLPLIFDHPPGGATATVVLDGQLQARLGLAWWVDGQEVPDGAGETIVVPPDAEVRVAVRRDGRELAAATGTVPPEGPRALGRPDGVLFAWRDTEAPVTLLGADAAPCAPPSAALATVLRRAGWAACFVSAAPGESVAASTSAGATVVGTAGVGPDSRAAIPSAESPLACGDRRFPGRAAGGIASCSTPGALDRFVTERGVIALPEAAPGRAHRAAYSSGSDDGPARLLFGDGPRVGGWAPGHDERVASRENAPEGRPTGRRDLLVLPRRQHHELLRFGTLARALLPTTEGASVGFAGQLLLQAEPGSSELRIRETQTGATGALPWSGTPRHVQSGGDWLIACAGDELAGLGLAGQGGWRLDMDTSFLDGRARLDDRLVVPVRDDHGVGLLLVDLASGVPVEVVLGEELLEVRGADVGGLGVWRRAAGTVGTLQTWPTALRVLEEGGAAATGPVRARLGGHGGRHAVLSAGESLTLSFTVERPSVIAAYRPASSPSAGSLRLFGGGAVRASEEPGWQTLGAVGVGTHTVLASADADGPGLSVDALRVSPRRAP